MIKTADGSCVLCHGTKVYYTKTGAHKCGHCAPEAADAPICDVQEMKTSAGSDFFVRVRVGDRELTPYVFKERYKAEYSAAEYRWLLLGEEKPDLMAYGPEGWPGSNGEG